MNNSLIIDKKEILPGENKVIDIQIARLTSGTWIDMPVYVYRSKKPGPVLLIMGGLHGDEVNGVEIVRRLIFEKAFNNLQCGSILAIPILNVFGFLNFSRDVTDGKDVNRSFPGSASGSLARGLPISLPTIFCHLLIMGWIFIPEADEEQITLRYDAGKKMPKHLK